MSDLLRLGSVLFLVALNGFFVAAEFSLVSVRPTRVDQLVAEGNRLAKLVKRAMQDPNRFISACQVGITMASLGLGWIAEPALAGIVEPPFVALFGEDSGVPIHLIGGILAYTIVTLLHIVLGEQVPKMVAIQRSEATVLFSVAPMNWITIPFRPLVSLLSWLTGLVLGIFKIEWQGEHQLGYSEEELRMVVTASRDQGYLDEAEQQIIQRVFGFSDVDADEIMIPRTAMTAFPHDATLIEVTQVVAATGHSRYPVYRENLDDILGVFYVKDLYVLLDQSTPEQFNLAKLARPPLMVPTATTLDDLLAAMKSKSSHIAIVIDEYGGTAGMVTLDNVLERIVGEVNDGDGNGHTADIEVRDNGETRVSGLLTLDEVNERFGLGLEDPIYNTIGGYVFGSLGRLPEVGDEVSVNGFLLRVSELDGLRIDRIDIIHKTQPVS